jgi:rubredoxin
MSRTPGSGWGAGPILWQLCPKCGKRKCYYAPINQDELKHYKPFRCTACKARFDSENLIKQLTK